MTLLSKEFDHRKARLLALALALAMQAMFIWLDIAGKKPTVTDDRNAALVFETAGVCLLLAACLVVWKRMKTSQAWLLTSIGFVMWLRSPFALLLFLALYFAEFAHMETA